MIIIASDTRKLSEPGFDDFTIYDDGEADVRVMGPEEAYEYALHVIKDRWVEAEEYIKQDYEWWHWYIFHWHTFHGHGGECMVGLL